MAYTLTGRKSGTVRFEPRSTGVIEKESESYSSSVTSNPIENGAEINLPVESPPHGTPRTALSS